MFKMFQYGNNTIANIRAWFRASLCNANQVSTCGCWPRKLEVRQLEINWKNIRKPCLLKESAMNVVGWMLEPLHDKRASRAVRRNINNVSVGFLYWYLPTPHFRPLHKLPKKMGFSRSNQPPTSIRLEPSWNQGSTYTWRECDLLPAAPGFRKLSRATHLWSSWFVPRMGGWNSKWVATYHRCHHPKRKGYPDVAFSVFMYDSVIATDL